MLKADRLLKGRTVLEVVADTEPAYVHIAVGFAARLMSDLGAQVVRLLPADDPLPKLKSLPDESVGDASVLATFLNHGKQLVAYDQANATLAAAEQPVHLVLRTAHAPVPVDHNICEVIASVAANDAGLEDLALSELGVQGLVGLTDLFGEPQQQPLMMGGHQTAYAMGYALFCAALASLTKQTFLQAVDTVHVNAVDALAWVNWKGVAAGTLGFPVVRGGKGAEAPVLKCADGHFALMHLPNNWDDIRAEVDDPRLDDDQFAKAGLRAKNAAALNAVLAEWAADKTWRSLYEFCQRCAIPGGPVLRGTQLLEDPLYLHRDYFVTAPHELNGEAKEVRIPGLPMSVEGMGEAGRMNANLALRYSENTPSNLPLSGKLVLDLGIFTAGSVTSTLLADLGATVIKVESASYSDPFRIWPGIEGDSPLFTFNNRNKLGVNLNLKTEQGKETFLQLVAQADVVVENFRRGVLKRLGIDYDVLKQVNPGIVLASISGQGASGPGSGHVSFGSTLEAIGGVAALTGYPGKGCYISGRNLNYPDQIVCLYGAGAVMAALLKAQTLGHGLHIDVSQREVTTLAVGEVVAAASLLGHDDDFPGNKDLNVYLQDIFAVADGWLCVTVATENEAAQLAEFLAVDLADLESALGAWLATQDARAATATLRETGVIAVKANTGAEAAQEAAVRSGMAFATTRSGAMVKGFPFQFENDPLTIYEESPFMGEHTEQVLQRLKTQNG